MTIELFNIKKLKPIENLQIKVKRCNLHICRNAFPGLCSRENKRPSASNNRNTKSNSRNTNTGRSFIPFVPKETWTHDFCVLSSTIQLFTPDREESNTLLQAGLGKRKLVCPNKNASHSEFQAFVESEFPKLKAGGGFELLRAAGGGGGKRKLQIVPPGCEGYNVPYVRGVVGSGVLFIRPLQVNLDISPVPYDVSYLFNPPLELYCRSFAAYYP